MPRLKQSAFDMRLIEIKAEVDRAMTLKGWSREHTADIVPWAVSQKYDKLCRFMREPQTISLGDFMLLSDKLGLEVLVKRKGDTK